jgi:hypothetical protein
MNKNVIQQYPHLIIWVPDLTDIGTMLSIDIKSSFKNYVCIFVFQILCFHKYLLKPAT